MKSIKRSILMPVLVFAVAMLAAAPAEAAKPFILKVPVDFTDTFNDCGFTIVEHIEGFFTIHVFFETNGNPRIEIDTFALKETFTTLPTASPFPRPTSDLTSSRFSRTDR